MSGFLCDCVKKWYENGVSYPKTVYIYDVKADGSIRLACQIHDATRWVK